MIELRFIKLLISEKEKIKEEVNVLIERTVEKIVSYEFDFFESVTMTIEVMLLRMLSLEKHILTNLKCVSEMLSVTILKRNVTRLRIETIDYTSHSLSILAAQTSRFLLTFLFFSNATNVDLHKLYAINAKQHELQDR
jgi:hypothetical protein